MSHSTEMYPLGRDEVESRRLNDQYQFVMEFSDGPIDKRIPLDGISTVADVATGTGIWLWDAQRLLNQRAGKSERYFHGFDISPAQFPPAPEGVEFSVQDVQKPFPAEHHNRYDLVNVRLLITALPEAEYQNAVANVLTILKPGGYLQWVEFDFSQAASGASRDPRVAPISRTWCKFMESSKMTQCAPETLHKAYENAGVLDIAIRLHLIPGREELNEQAKIWQFQFFSTALPVLLMKTGEVKDATQAAERASEMLAGLTEYLTDEVMIMPLRVGTVAGQKPR
ncbi:hypothetical protein BJX76DRAFT_332971 [Aspergillus varians]